MYKISYKDILYNTGTRLVFYNNYKWSITFKIILYTCNLYNIVDQYNLIFVKKGQPGREKIKYYESDQPRLKPGIYYVLTVQLWMKKLSELHFPHL